MTADAFPRTHETTPSPLPPRRWCVFGAPGSNTNLGLAALSQSLVVQLSGRAPGSHFTVFDYKRGHRSAAVSINGQEIPYELVGAWRSRRVHRREAFANLRLRDLGGGLGSPGAKALSDADAVLDASGGDSFTDLYGYHRFRTVALPKILGGRPGRRLVLLPQTYGPFASGRARDEARRLVLRAHQAWARDPRSYQALQDLLGDDCDPRHHRQGVDMAFLLHRREPPASHHDSRAFAWVTDQSTPLVGLNISGLLYNDPHGGRDFGLRANYREAVASLLRRLLTRTDARVILLPHVLGRAGPVESDNGATEALLARLSPEAAARVATVPWTVDPAVAKWYASLTSWFCGTRMHSTIAALSSGVPTAAIAYSIKTLGVFETCSMGGAVAEARCLDTADLVDHLWGSFERRKQGCDVLTRALPGVIARAHEQFDEIARVGS